ncbi:hypothetical protein BCY89_17425 [Sphingobacterium siyangense]|uniref:HD domain-containing protein n=1 Tax=Sphingobacterium siyangense TaxID=459529 RepID=A0A420FG78_9SPHI|nr:dGTPase [Sphingobacterium siyangense]RKF31929.1 hypothetical protein BCY89_17425 [Sphingobacterium siyangense]
MYSQLITAERRKPSSIGDRNLIDETSSDKSRVIFSGPFRRLQQKAQVFSLETNSSVRSRLTHSLEVADYGKLIAYKITNSLIEAGNLKSELQIPFVNIVETACLLHDVGNLPFGHFGEAAIQQWFKKHWEKYFKKAIGENIQMDEISKLMADFIEFDGNPQGFRIVTTLQNPAMGYIGYGLNLTKTQLFSFLKYLRTAGEEKGEGIYKKAGFFNSEKHIVDNLKTTFNRIGRFPLAYIMEAADDMSYCLSDIEDGVEKGILSIREFFEYLRIEWKKLSSNVSLPFDLDLIIDSESTSYNDKFFFFKTKVARSLIEVSSKTYVERHSDILNGKVDQLIEKESDADKLLESLKSLSKKHLFRSREAENNELAGHAVIYGLLEKFSLLLSIPRDHFQSLIDFKNDSKSIKGKDLDIELRLFNRLPAKYIEAYEYAIHNNPCNFALSHDELEWYYRCHLIVDFIAGMTDLYSLNLYKLLHGIKID